MKATFEPVKEKKPKKEKAEGELQKEAIKAEKARKKREQVLDFAMAKIAAKITEKATRLLMEFAATVLSAVAK